MLFRIDKTSFFLGIAAATFVWWFVFILKLIWERISKKIQQDKEAKEHSSNLLVENVYLNYLHKQTQEMHAAGKLFSLDEIIIEPKLLAPPLIFEPNGPHLHLDITEETLPYLPDFPELSAAFGAPVLTINEAISKGMNIIITGNPGSGKTTALASYTSMLARTKLSDESNSGKIPFLIHAADLDLPQIGSIKPKEVLQPLISGLQEKMGYMLGLRIGQYVEFIFGHENCILLIDGIDELAFGDIPSYSNYIKLLLKTYPNTRIIVAAGNDYLDGLLSPNFTQLALVPWNKDELTTFISKWENLWEKYVAKQDWAAPFLINIDKYLVNNWLLQDNFGLSPLEFTMKTWNAYTGSNSSSGLSDITTTFIQRLIPDKVPEELLVSIAVNCAANKQFFFSSAQLVNRLAAYDIITDIPLSERSNNGSFINILKTLGIDKYLGNLFPNRDQKSVNSTISKLIRSGIICIHKNNKIRFANPVYFAYFVSKGLSNNQKESLDSIINTSWSGQYIVSKYISLNCDITDNLQYFSSSNEYLIKKKLLFAGRLLSSSENNITPDTRRQILTRLITIISDDNNPVGLKTEALVVILKSGSTETSEILRQFLHSTSNELRYLAALGFGILRDQKVVTELTEVIDTSSELVRRAVCLALAEIGSNLALETLATFLLNRDEKLRNYSAEALANHEDEGHEALQEGINNNDILVRRAVIFGLSRVKNYWANEILEKVQLNDDQWAVRNLAIEVLKSKNNPNPRIPAAFKPVHETPWVIEYAHKHGYVLSPILPNTELLLLALKDPNKDLFQSALNLLKDAVNPDVLSRILELRQLNDERVKESIYQFFKHAALKGVFQKE